MYKKALIKLNIYEIRMYKNKANLPDTEKRIDLKPVRTLKT